MSERCKAIVPMGRMLTGQCKKSVVRDGYCGEHHPEVEKARHEKREAQIVEAIAKRELAASIAKAERAIVDAADALRSEVDGECVALFARRQDELFRAVDAWRKLRGER